MAAEPVTAYVGLGSNLDDPVRRVEGALADLGRLPDTRLHAASRLYRTVPWGMTDQPDFVNAAARLETLLPAHALLDELQALERAAGRQRGARRWGPRVLDLDILLFGGTECRDARLTLPHPRLHARAFVLAPLLELEPSLEIPGHGPAAHLLEGLDESGVEALERGA